MSVALYKNTVSPLLMQWRYYSLALSHWYVLGQIAPVPVQEEGSVHDDVYGVLPAKLGDQGN